MPIVDQTGIPLLQPFRERTMDALPSGDETAMAPTYQILVIDDDRAFREVLCELLEPCLTPIEAECGEQALELADDANFHIVMCDMHMRELTGLETLTRLRDRGFHVPGLLMTADYTEDLARTARDGIAFDVLKKPISKSLLRNTLATAMGLTYHDAGIVNRLLEL